MTEMTSHERFRRMYEHREADHVPILDSPWGATIERWQKEGMPEAADWVDFFVATPLLGTEMYDQFVDMGYLGKHEPVWKQAYVRGRHFDTKEISADALVEFAYRANLTCNFIDNGNVRAGNYERAISLLDSVLFRYPFHLGALYSKIECYKGLGRAKDVEALTAEVSRLIKTNPLAADMYEKYNDLFRFAPEAAG